MKMVRFVLSVFLISCIGLTVQAAGKDRLGSEDLNESFSCYDTPQPVRMAENFSHDQDQSDQPEWDRNLKSSTKINLGDLLKQAWDSLPNSQWFEFKDRFIQNVSEAFSKLGENEKCALLFSPAAGVDLADMLVYEHVRKRLAAIMQTYSPHILNVEVDLKVLTPHGWHAIIDKVAFPNLLCVGLMSGGINPCLEAMQVASLLKKSSSLKAILFDSMTPDAMTALVDHIPEGVEGLEFIAMNLTSELIPLLRPLTNLKMLNVDLVQKDQEVEWFFQNISIGTDVLVQIATMGIKEVNLPQNYKEFYEKLLQVEETGNLNSAEFWGLSTQEFRSILTGFNLKTVHFTAYEVSGEDLSLLPDSLSELILDNFEDNVEQFVTHLSRLKKLEVFVMQKQLDAQVIQVLPSLENLQALFLSVDTGTCKVLLDVLPKLAKLSMLGLKISDVQKFLASEINQQISSLVDTLKAMKSLTGIFWKEEREDLDDAVQVAFKLSSIQILTAEFPWEKLTKLYENFKSAQNGQFVWPEFFAPPSEIFSCLAQMSNLNDLDLANLYLQDESVKQQVLTGLAALKNLAQLRLPVESSQDSFVSAVRDIVSEDCLLYVKNGDCIPKP